MMDQEMIRILFLLLAEASSTRFDVHKIPEINSAMHHHLLKDVSTVKKLVDDSVTCQLSSSLRPHDAVSALGPMYDVHDKNHLPKMQACDHSISKLLDFCIDKKNEMNNFVHNYMQRVTYVSYIIKDTRYQFPVFKEAMARQDTLFADLKLVRGIGPAYRACLAEVVRRKASMKLYMGMAGQLAEKLATKREAEVRRREDLLDIDISNLDRYAPEYLAGLPSKIERHGSTTSKGSFSMSHSAEAEENTVDALEKYDSEELLDGCELVEIVGTSKLEVENAKLKAELASAIASICSFGLEVEYDSLDDSKRDHLLKSAADKTAEALHLKDEYGKHLESMLRMKQIQCVSYEKRIQELEQKLSDQYLQSQKLSGNKDASDFALLAAKADDCKSEISGDGEGHMPYISTTEPMDEVSCASNSLDAKLGIFPRQTGKSREGLDENMADSSGMINPQLDSSMLEPHLEELQVSDKDGKDKMVEQLGMALTNSFTAESTPEPLNVLPCDRSVEPDMNSKISNDVVLELQSKLAEKTNQLDETEAKLKAAVEEVAMLSRELENSRKLLDESQMPSLDPASGLDFLDLGCFAILPGTCYFFGIQNLVWSLACLMVYQPYPIEVWTVNDL
ncbi:Autophagy-related protein 11 [Vitis vinifera]|uniref:Autophagy-related protein 11 n=1 Tax=Vitis vinifera TaxID=29760 RepID=A0A438GT74_VITVI|nr:Autophagy-related protein 11 [Vitis vinifera]